ncbi:MAG: LysR family transcriptional regulator [Pseudomonadota bacterium]
MSAAPEWSDVRIFLAAARAGTLSDAAKSLKLSQPTLSRRLDQLEESLSTQLFIRGRRGLTLTNAGEAALTSAETMERGAADFARLSTGQDPSLTGTVRISVLESLGGRWLVDHLRQFHKCYPEIKLEISVSYGLADLVRREADIAIRMVRPMQNDLIARKVGTFDFGIYASPTYLEAHGTPKTMSELDNHDFVFPEGPIYDAICKAWPAIIRYEPRAVFRSNHLRALISATASGFGIGLHSAISAQDFPSLVRLLPETTDLSAPMWLISHPDVRRSARIRAAYDGLVTLFSEQAHVFRHPIETSE